MLQALFNLPRNVWLLGFISLVNDSASEMLYPLVPLYLTSVLGAGSRALGLMEGIAEATASLLKLFSGLLVDKTGKTKPWIVFGYGIAGFGRPLIALATNWLWVLAVRFADRVGKGLRTSPRDTLLAACTETGHRGLAFGLHRAMDNAGAVIGPLAAWGLLAYGLPLRQIFCWALVPAIICLGLSLGLREPKAATQQVAAPGFNWKLQGLPPAFKKYLFVAALFTMGNSSNMFLLLRASDLGVQAAYIPLLWTTVSATAMIFSIPLTALSDRLGRTAILTCGYIAYGLFYVGMSLVGHSLPALFALFAFYGLFLGATEGVEKTLVADLAPQGMRGAAFGWFNLTVGFFLLPASVIFGAIYAATTPAWAFLFSAGCSFAAALLLVCLVRPTARSGSRA